MHAGPFATESHFGRAAVMGALPADFPLPPDARLRDTGAGHALPYSISWESPAQTSEVAGMMARRLDGGSWQVVEASDADGVVRLRSAREGAVATIADVRIAANGEGSRVDVEFSPIPASDVPGYDRWLEERGIIVRYIEPGTSP